MAEAAADARSGKVVIRNIGLLLSGDLDRPILDADTLVVDDGLITAVGKLADCNTEGAKTVIDARGTCVAPGLIDSHVHPVFGDWTPRQNQLGWIESTLNGGVTSMISAGEVHLPGRPKDIVGLKARLAGEAVLDSDRWMPQISAGLEFKHTDAGALGPNQIALVVATMIAVVRCWNAHIEGRKLLKLYTEMKGSISFPEISKGKPPTSSR